MMYRTLDLLKSTSMNDYRQRNHRYTYLRPLEAQL